MSIGQRIKTSRKAVGMSQTQLAQKVGLTQPTLSDLENDESKGSMKLASIAQALGVRSFWLETGRGASTPGAAENLSENHELSDEAMEIARAFDQLKTAPQKESVRAQLRAFGVLT